MVGECTIGIELPSLSFSEGIGALMFAMVDVELGRLQV